LEKAVVTLLKISADELMQASATEGNRTDNDMKAARKWGQENLRIKCTDRYFAGI